MSSVTHWEAATLAEMRSNGEAFPPRLRLVCPRSFPGLNRAVHAAHLTLFVRPDARQYLPIEKVHLQVSALLGQLNVP